MIRGAPRPRFRYQRETITPIRLDEVELYISRGPMSIRTLKKSSSFDHRTFSRNRACLHCAPGKCSGRGPLPVPCPQESHVQVRRRAISKNQHEQRMCPQGRDPAQSFPEKRKPQIRRSKILLKLWRSRIQQAGSAAICLENARIKGQNSRSL